MFKYIHCFEMYIFSKEVTAINHFFMLYVLCSKVNNFGTCKHNGKRFVNQFFLTLNTYCTTLLIVRLIKKWYQNDSTLYFK
jgi:hypothetical protein